MPAAKPARLPADDGPAASPDGVVLTTGKVAALCGVAPRTATKWCDADGLPHWKLPCSPDRRIFAHELRAFLLRHNAHVPAELDALCGLRRELVLYHCPAALADALAGRAPARVEVRVVEDAWDLGRLFARPFTGGVLVVGDGAAVSEAARLFARVPAGWVKAHAPGADQEPAAGADHVVGPDGGVPEALARALAGAA